LSAEDVKTVKAISIQMATNLKIVSKRPIAQHFKEGVVINVFANIFQIVMLPTGTNTFLTVRGAFQLCKLRIRINSSKKNGLELGRVG
jgi:hypothetical protein